MYFKKTHTILSETAVHFAPQFARHNCTVEHTNVAFCCDEFIIIIVIIGCVAVCAADVICAAIVDAVQ